MQSISFAKIMRQKGIKPPPLCFATQNIGEVARSDGGVEKRYLISRFISDIQPPRPTGTPPISFTTSRGRGDLNLSSPRSVFSNPSVLRTPPLYFALQNTP